MPQVVVGWFGIIGIMLKYITPLTIAPAVTMIGLGLDHLVSLQRSGTLSHDSTMEI